MVLYLGRQLTFVLYLVCMLLLNCPVVKLLFFTVQLQMYISKTLHSDVGHLVLCILHSLFSCQCHQKITLVGWFQLDFLAWLVFGYYLTPVRHHLHPGFLSKWGRSHAQLGNSSETYLSYSLCSLILKD